MKYLVDSREMQKYDANTISHFKVPGLLLMERAAIAFVEELHRQNVDLTEVLIVCGSGNNGGDGLAIARLLFLEGHAVTVVYAGNKEHCSESNRVQQDILNAYGISIYMDIPEKIRPTLVIDAIFGVGLSRDVTGEYADMLCRMNELSGEKAAVDIASGISADTGAILGTAFRADLTITFAFEKLGSILWPGNEYAGRIIVCDIGITKESWLGEPPAVMALEKKDFSILPKRKSHSNKGSYGKLLLIAGSVNMAGAAVLSAKAAYATGCGLVRVLTPGENRTIFQKNLLQTAADFADENQVICVLKDEHTVTALPDHKRYLNLSGNPGMATAGSGDVLSGLIGALMAQKLTSYQAAPLGVYLHGLAGDIMVQTTGLQGLTASDLITGIKKVLNIYT